MHLYRVSFAFGVKINVRQFLRFERIDRGLSFELTKQVDLKQVTHVH